MRRKKYSVLPIVFEIPGYLPHENNVPHLLLGNMLLAEQLIPPGAKIKFCKDPGIK